MGNTKKQGKGTQKRTTHKINHFKIKSKVGGKQESPHNRLCFKINNKKKLSQTRNKVRKMNNRYRRQAKNIRHVYNRSLIKKEYEAREQHKK